MTADPAVFIVTRAAIFKSCMVACSDSGMRARWVAGSIPSQ